MAPLPLSRHNWPTHILIVILLCMVMSIYVRSYYAPLRGGVSGDDDAQEFTIIQSWLAFLTPDHLRHGTPIVVQDRRVAAAGSAVASTVLKFGHIARWSSTDTAATPVTVISKCVELFASDADAVITLVHPRRMKQLGDGVAMRGISMRVHPSDAIEARGVPYVTVKLHRGQSIIIPTWFSYQITESASPYHMTIYHDPITILISIYLTCCATIGLRR